MIDCCDLVSALAERGWNHGGGVPCSTFAGPIAHLSAAGAYRAAANEGLALSDAAGAHLAGRPQAVFLQNSGLGNLVNPLTSLCQPYAIPVLALVSMRGWPDPHADEPQHSVMGRSTGALLADLGVWHRSVAETDLELALDQALETVYRGEPAFLLVPHRSIGRHPAAVPAIQTAGPDTADVAAVLATVCQAATVVFSTTGHASRYLHNAGDRPRNFYMQGSMGHVSSLALGYATASPREKVIIFDGDGAALMHLGVFSTIGAEHPHNLVHVIVDNGGYESTGSQPCTSRTTDLAGVARACGYLAASTVDSLESFRQQFAFAVSSHGPHLIVVRAAATTREAPQRAGASLALPHIAARLRDQAFLGTAASHA